MKRSLNDLIEEVNKVYEDCKEPGWDSYDCPAITSEMRDKAIELLKVVYPITHDSRFCIRADVEGGYAFMFYIDKGKDQKLASWWEINEEGLIHIWTPIPMTTADDQGYDFNDMYYKPLEGKTGYAKCNDCGKAIKEAENDSD